LSLPRAVTPSSSTFRISQVWLEPSVADEFVGEAGRREGGGERGGGGEAGELAHGFLQGDAQD